MTERVKDNRSTPPSSGVLLSIQAIRGMAVTLLIVIHIQFYFTNQLHMPDFLPQVNIIAAVVDVFFVISGFIILYSSERLFGQPHGMRIYYLRRIARIVPLYWAGTTILLTYVLLHYGSIAGAGGAGWDYVIASYFFWPKGRPDGWWTPLLGVGWTLNYEVFYYVLFGLCIPLSRRAAVWIIGALFVVLIAIRYFYPDLPSPFAFWFNPLIIEFVAGMVVALAYRNGMRLRTWQSYSLIAVSLAVLGWSWSEAHLFDPSSWVRVPLWGMPAFAIVAAFALAEKRVPQNLFWRTFGFLGDASYSIYVIHSLLLGVPLMVFGKWIAPQDAPWFYVFCIAFATTLPALLSYLYVEKPLTEALQRRIERGHRPQAAAVAQTAPGIST